MPAWLAARPSTFGSNVHWTWLTFSLERGAPLRALLGDRPDSTPLSVIGPSCSGSLLAMVDGDAPAYLHVARAMCGAEALARCPFARADVAPFHVEHPAARFIPRWCRLCAGRVLDLWHLAFECPHPAFRRLAARRRSGTMRLLRKIASMAADAIRASGGMQPTLAPSDVAAFADLARGGPSWQAAHSTDAVLYFVLLGVPWGPARFPDHAGAVALGKLFLAANIRQSHLRPLALAWLTFSEAALAELATAWREADAAPFRGAWEPAYAWHRLRHWLRAHVVAPARRLLAAVRRHATLLAKAAARCFRRFARAPFRRLLKLACRHATVLSAAARRLASFSARLAAKAVRLSGPALQRIVRRAALAGLLPLDTAAHLRAARRRASTCALYCAHVLADWRLPWIHLLILAIAFSAELIVRYSVP